MCEKQKKYVQEKCRDTNMLLQVQLLFGWRAITHKPWLISAGRLSPHHGKSVMSHMSCGDGDNDDDEEEEE